MVLKGLNIDGIIKIDNARVYGLEESIIASGYPMQVDTYDLDEDELDEEYVSVDMRYYEGDVREYIEDNDIDMVVMIYNPHMLTDDNAFNL